MTTNERTQRWLRRIGAPLLLSFFWTAAIPAYAQTDGQGGLAPALEKNADPIEKLEMLQRKLEQDRERQRRLDERKSALEAEMGKLQAQLVDAAGEAAALERRQSDAETKLAELSIQERSAETAFLEKRDKLAGLLAVLQRMGREPPPALLVQPGNAADAARSAMVLTTVLPSVRTDAQNLGRALAELRALRQAAAKTKIDLGKANEQLASQRTHIAALLTDKNKLADETSSELRAAGARVQTLSREVQDVSELIRRVKGEVKALTDSGFSAAQFAARRGQLPWPAAGEIVANFGEDNELGLRNDGIAVKTRPNAQVVSPVDGKIAFAGPFPGYGNMLIIVAGDDYHIVLSGMEAIYGAAGQPLLAGEPVGKMGAQVQGGARLGIEFRHGRNPVDPKPWFGARNERILDKGQG